MILYDARTGNVKDEYDEFIVYPANVFVTSKRRLGQIIEQIQQDLFLQIKYFKDQNRLVEAKRIEERVSYDLEMIKELGYCSGIENYSRYFDGRKTRRKTFLFIRLFS